MGVKSKAEGFTQVEARQRWRNCYVALGTRCQPYTPKSFGARLLMSESRQKTTATTIVA